ncbi:hypothetical protein Agau_C201675 [Agrobacterium tumefaciens F2]|nr:hypothetical protein Agau_C201675 [Agrobacterium tumefaciens F2]
MRNKKIAELLHEYFELGVAEGREGRNHDTEAGDAQRVLSEIEAEIAALSAAEPVSSIVPDHCSGTALIFEGGCLHVRKDGSGHIVVDEDDFKLEDDRCEGEHGSEGSVHWIARFPAGEMTALRNFLNGQDFPAPPAPSSARPQCCMCGKKGLSTVEGDGGTECELSDGRWVCSSECYDRAVEPAPSVAVKALHQAASDFMHLFIQDGHLTMQDLEDTDLIPAYEKLSAALSAQVQDVAGWQSIDSAPKDGTRILIWFVHPNARFSKDPVAEGWAAAHEAYWTDHNRGGWTWHGLCGAPTLWQHLPAAPAKQER